MLFSQRLILNVGRNSSFWKKFKVVYGAVCLFVEVFCPWVWAHIVCTLCFVCVCVRERGREGNFPFECFLKNISLKSTRKKKQVNRN